MKGPCPRFLPRCTNSSACDSVAHLHRLHPKNPNLVTLCRCFDRSFNSTSTSADSCSNASILESSGVDFLSSSSSSVRCVPRSDPRPQNRASSSHISWIWSSDYQLPSSTPTPGEPQNPHTYNKHQAPNTKHQTPNTTKPSKSQTLKPSNPQIQARGPREQLHHLAPHAPRTSPSIHTATSSPRICQGCGRIPRFSLPPHPCTCPILPPAPLHDPALGANIVLEQRPRRESAATPAQHRMAGHTKEKTRGSSEGSPSVSAAVRPVHPGPDSPVAVVAGATH